MYNMNFRLAGAIYPPSWGSLFNIMFGRTNCVQTAYKTRTSGNLLHTISDFFLILEICKASKFKIVQT